MFVLRREVGAALFSARQLVPRLQQHLFCSLNFHSKVKVSAAGKIVFTFEFGAHPVGVWRVCVKPYIYKGYILFVFLSLYTPHPGPVSDATSF